MDAMRKAIQGFKGIDAATAAIMVFYARLEKPRLVEALFASAGYRQAIRNELGSLVVRDSHLPPKERAVLPDAILGALYGIYQASGPGDGKTAAMFGLRCLGLSDSMARKAVERYSLQGTKT
jgi:hypothetical protein